MFIHDVETIWNHLDFQQKNNCIYNLDSKNLVLYFFQLFLKNSREYVLPNQLVSD